MSSRQTHDVARLPLRLGPLHYVLQAHGAGGRRELSAISRGVRCPGVAGRADRVVHVMTVKPDGSTPFISVGLLPDQVRSVVAEDLPQRGWEASWREINWIVWDHPACRSAFWVWTRPENEKPKPYQLPWALLHRDLALRGGSLCHAALATDPDGAGHLFVAPADGGKTTTVARLPETWRVLGDDTCLVWSVGEGESRRWQASPLPSWGSLLGKTRRPARIGRWEVGEVRDVRRVLVLRKRPFSSLTGLSALAATTPLYCAFLEHPQLHSQRDDVRTYAFRLAADLARSVPAQRLELTLEADLGSLLGR